MVLCLAPNLLKNRAYFIYHHHYYLCKITCTFAISSIVHEVGHVKESILEEYNVDNYGDPPAYTIGYIVKEIYSVFNKYVRMDADL